MQVLLLYCLIRIGVIFGFQFSEEDVMRTYVTSVGYVFYLESDEYEQGNLLFSSTKYSLGTTNGNTTAAIDIHPAGDGEDTTTSARTRTPEISSFIQQSETSIIAVDYSNCCLSSLERLTNVTSRYVSKCEDYSNTVCVRSIIRDLKNPGHYFLADDRGKSLSYLSESDKNVTTLHRGINSYRYMCQQQTTGDIFVTYPHGLDVYNYRDNTMLNRVRSSANRFGNPLDILLLTENTLLVADSGNNTLRVLDLSTNTSTSICSGTVGQVDGNLSDCRLVAPWSLLIWQNTLYIGEDTAIRTVRGTSFTTHTPELSHHTSPSISTTTETVTTTTTERLSVKSSATTNTLHPKPTEAEETARTTGKSTEPSSISDLHIALISSAAGIIAVISVLIFVAYIVRLRTKANNRYKGSAATGVGMQEVTSHPSNGENQAGQEESPDETYAELNTGTYYNDHVYSVPT